MCCFPSATPNIGRGPCRNHHQRSQVVGLVIVRLALNQNTSHIGRLPTPYVQYVLPFAQANAANFSQNAPKTHTDHTLNICVDRQYKTWQLAQTKSVKAWWKILPCNSLSTCIPHACGRLDSTKHDADKKKGKSQHHQEEVPHATENHRVLAWTSSLALKPPAWHNSAYMDLFECRLAGEHGIADRIGSWHELTW